MYNLPMHVTGLGQCSLDSLSLVDEYPSVDSKKEVLEWHEQGGGPVATALVALSKIGLSCSFYGIVGDDAPGWKIRQSLSEEGIDLKGLMTRKGSFSQVAFIAVEKSTARRTIFWRRATARPLQPDEIGSDFLRDSSFLLLDGLMMEASVMAARKAKELNIPVMLDAGSARPGMIGLAGICDYVVASEVFAKGLGWELNPEALLKEYEKLGVRALTITQGERGSITIEGERILITPAFRVEAVDTTGAGDVFHAGYIFGLLKGWDIAEVVRFASVFAALKCRKIGGRAGIADLNEVMRIMGKER